MKILNLVAQAEVDILQEKDATKVMSSLCKDVEQQHRIDLKHAFNRGRMSVIATFVMTDEEYCNKFYTKEDERN